MMVRDVTVHGERLVIALVADGHCGKDASMHCKATAIDELLKALHDAPVGPSPDATHVPPQMAVGSSEPPQMAVGSSMPDRRPISEAASVTGTASAHASAGRPVNVNGSALPGSLADGSHVIAAGRRAFLVTHDEVRALRTILMTTGDG
eukprot:jgi/Chrpa1/8966/Chrysochromulina_OHIO_Genome00014135-RA